jgi:adenylylsulfate kinase
LAHQVEDILHKSGANTFVLDGDNVRHGLCSNLGFSAGDRVENIRRIGEVAKLFLEAGVIVLTAFISPYREDRERVRGLVPHGDFMEIFCDCPLDICEKRDVKGLYKKARRGEIKDYTGVSSPYEAPISPELVVDTANLTLDESAQMVISLLKSKKTI